MHESRLRAMLDPSSLADWSLNAEDRAAIQWAFDMIASLKNELQECRSISREAHNRIGSLLARAQNAIDTLNKPIQ